MFRLVRPLMAALAAVLSVCSLSAQTGNAAIRTKVKEHFEQYQGEFDLKTLKIERTDINRNGRRLDIYLNQNFSYQLFRHELIDSIYAGLRRDLPGDIRRREGDSSHGRHSHLPG